MVGPSKDEQLDDLQEIMRNSGYLQWKLLTTGRAGGAAQYKAETLAEALRLIGTECSTFTGGSDCIKAGRYAHAVFTAERWCDQCIARVALRAVGEHA